RGARLAHPEAFREERHGDRRDVVTRRARSHPPDELAPVLGGHAEVAPDAVDVRGAQELAGLRDGTGGEHESAEGLEGGDEKLYRIVVVDDHQGGDSGRGASVSGASEL